MAQCPLSRTGRSRQFGRASAPTMPERHRHVVGSTIGAQHRLMIASQRDIAIDLTAGTSTVRRDFEG
jgi:hypothetical protein